MSSPTAAEFARFDQAHAEVSVRLDDLIAAWRDTLVDSAAPREVDLAGLGVYLREHADHDALAELLAVAVDRLGCDGGECG